MEVENQEVEEIVEPIIADTVDPVEPIEEPAEPVIEAEPVAYEPNLKYSFMDQELEFDDKVKGFIKSKEDEDFFRDMVTANAAHGKYKEFGSIRDLETKMGEHESYQKSHGELQEFNKEVSEMGKWLQSGNDAGFEQFRQHLGIKEDQIMNWAIKRAQGMQNPEVANQIQQEYSTHMQDYNLQSQNNNLQSQNEVLQNSINEQKYNQNMTMLDSQLGSSEIAQAFDNNLGAGSFKQAVIDNAEKVWRETGTELSPQDAYEAVANKFGGLVTSSVGTQTSQQAPQQNQASNPEQTVVIKQNNATIPNVRGGSNSPVKPKLMSLEGTRAHAKTL